VSGRDCLEPFGHSVVCILFYACGLNNYQQFTGNRTQAPTFGGMSNYQLVTVFGDRKLRLNGNTAAVVNLDTPISEDRMQAIAADFCQPATSFLWPAYDEGAYHIRWFAPDGEIDLCGHGSLAAIASLNKSTGPVKLHYKTGVIVAERDGSEDAHIDIQGIATKDEEKVPAIVEEALGISIKEYFPTDNKHILVVEQEEMVRDMKPDFATLRQHPNFGWIVTSEGREVDFVSRTLVPHVGQLEDPATGSSHACLTPFWSNRLSKTKMNALQLSRRGARFHCEMDGETVRLKGEFDVWGSGTIRP